MIRKSMPSDLIRGWVPVFPRDKREAFARRSCSNKKMERDDDSKKSHPAPGLIEKRGLIEKKPRRILRGFFCFSLAQASSGSCAHAHHEAIEAQFGHLHPCQRFAAVG